MSDKGHRVYHSSEAELEEESKYTPIGSRFYLPLEATADHPQIRCQGGMPVLPSHLHRALRYFFVILSFLARHCQEIVSRMLRTCWRTRRTRKTDKCDASKSEKFPSTGETADAAGGFDIRRLR